MIQKSSFIKKMTLLVFITLLGINVNAQQDPQFTHYMYNTMTVNPAYAGQRDVLSANLLYRTQWVGIKDAPRSLTFGAHSPLRNERVGLGLNVVSDQLGPATEISIDANVSYTIPLDIFEDSELSFGLKGGVHSLQTDWSKGERDFNDPLFQEDISLLSPTLGAALYFHSSRWYLGASIPNILDTEHYNNDVKESIATERLHYFLIGGYVFDLSDSVKLKPAFLVKGVSGAPLIADLSANALINNKFTLGLAYRWDDSFSGLVGFQINDNILIGYSYDATTTALRGYNSGTHEIMLRFELQKAGKILSPRFF